MNPYSNEAQCAQVKPNANIDAELGELCSEVGALQEIIEILEGRLRGVCIAEIDMAPKVSGDVLEKAKSPLAQELYARVFCVRTARDRIAQIIHCLDL